MAWTSSLSAGNGRCAAKSHPQDVGQQHGVGVVGLAAGHRVPLAVAGHRQRVDRIHRPVARSAAINSPRGVSIATGIGASALSPASASSTSSCSKPSTVSGDPAFWRPTNRRY
jgi:hypothetical protein